MDYGRRFRDTSAEEEMLEGVGGVPGLVRPPTALSTGAEVHTAMGVIACAAERHNRVSAHKYSQIDIPTR